jgi:hypothetical protein
MVIIMFYAFNLVQRVHFSNFDFSAVTNQLGYIDNTNTRMFELTRGVYENTTSYNAGGIQLTFLRSSDYKLNSFIRENGNALVYYTLAILGLCIFIISVIMIMGNLIKNH